MSAKGYVEYVKKHGYHFTEKLAEHVSKMLYNKIPQLQYIPESQISDLIETHKINLNKKATLGDMIYATNVAYSTFYPDLLKDMKAWSRLLPFAKIAAANASSLPLSRQ